MSPRRGSFTFLRWFRKRKNYDVMRRCRFLFIISVFGLKTFAQDTLVTGLRDACPDEMERYVNPGAILRSLNFVDPPKSKDLSKYVAVIGDQGQQGSCTAFSVAQALTIMMNQKDNKIFNRNLAEDYNRFLSPAFVFNIGKSKYPHPRSENCADGISYIDAFVVTRDFGISSWANSKYNSSGNSGCESQYFPSKRALTEGAKNKIATFQRPDMNVNLFKNLLADDPGYPICIAVHIDKGYKAASNRTNGSPIWRTNGGAIPNQTNDRHAMVIVGYADSIGCFKVLDSRGKTKGDEGFIWMSYDLLSNGTIYDAYVCSFDDRLLKSQKSTGEADLDIQVGGIKETWLKKGFFRTFNGLRVDCLDLDSKNGTAVISITDANTGLMLVSGQVLLLNEQKYFSFKGRTFSIFPKFFQTRGANVFKKALVFDVSLSNEAITEEFVQKGSLREDLEYLYKATFVPPTGRKQVLVYSGIYGRLAIGDLYNKSDNLIMKGPLPLDSLKLLISSGPLATIHNYQGQRVQGAVRPTNTDFHFNYLLSATGAQFSKEMQDFLNRNSDATITDVTWEEEVLMYNQFVNYLNAHPNYQGYIDQLKIKDNKIVTSAVSILKLAGTLRIEEQPPLPLKEQLSKGVTIALENLQPRINTMTLRLSDDGSTIQVSFNGKIPVFGEIMKNM